MGMSMMFVYWEGSIPMIFSDRNPHVSLQKHPAGIAGCQSSYVVILQLQSHEFNRRNRHVCRFMRNISDNFLSVPFNPITWIIYKSLLLINIFSNWIIYIYSSQWDFQLDDYNICKFIPSNLHWNNFRAIARTRTAGFPWPSGAPSWRPASWASAGSREKVKPGDICCKDPSNVHKPWYLYIYIHK